jgi:uncharacterized repeat protein (TIGR01451 family)
MQSHPGLFKRHTALRLLVLVSLLLVAIGYAPRDAAAAPPGAVDLAFDGGLAGTIVGSGFTTVLGGPTGTHLDTSKLSVTAGTLRITTTSGDLLPGGAIQDNALAIQYDSSGSYTIGARLLKQQLTPLLFNSPFQSAGIFIGKSGSQYIRFTAGKGSKGSTAERLQLDVMDTNGKLRSSTITLPNGTFAGVASSLDLFLNIDHTGSGKITALYRIDSDAPEAGQLMTARNFPRWLRQGNAVPVYAGVVGTNRGALTPLQLAFDWFRLTNAPQAVASVTGSKTVDRDGITGPTVNPGATLTYTISVTNNGTATNVAVSDPLPVDTTYVPNSATNGASFDPATNRVTWSNQSLGKGLTASFGFAVTINQAPLQSSTIVNTAFLTSGASALPSLLSTSTVVGLTPDLTASAYTAAPATVDQFGTITYTLNMQNSGTASASGVTAQLSIPAGTTLVPNSATKSSGTLSIDPSLTSLNWTRGAAMAPGDTATIAFAVKPGGGLANGAELASQALLQADGTLPTIQTAQAIFSTPSTLVGSKIVDKGEADRGETLTYTITVANNGATAAQNLKVVDPLPLDATFVDGSLTTPITGTATIDAQQRTVTWTLPSLGAGRSVSVDLKVTINQLLHSAVILNKAVLTNPAASVPQTLLSAATVVRGVADLSGSLYTANPARASLGGTVTYTLNLLNDGTGAATGATAQLTIPTGTTLVPNSAVASSGTATVNTALNTITWTAAGPLPIGATARVAFRAQIGSTISTSVFLSKATLQAATTAQIEKTAQSSFVQSVPTKRFMYLPMIRS